MIDVLQEQTQSTFNVQNHLYFSHLVPVLPTKTKESYSVFLAPRDFFEDFFFSLDDESSSSLKDMTFSHSPKTTLVKRVDRMHAGERYSSAGYKRLGLYYTLKLKVSDRLPELL
jgi:hypothetical protein